MAWLDGMLHCRVHGRMQEKGGVQLRCCCGCVCAQLTMSNVQKGSKLLWCALRYDLDRQPGRLPGAHLSILQNKFYKTVAPCWPYCLAARRALLPRHVCTPHPQQH